MLGYSLEKGVRAKRPEPRREIRITREPPMAGVAIAPFGKQAGMSRKSSMLLIA